jgi:hypothetical protein
LEIAIREGTSNDSYTTLQPRQPISPTPYAMYAHNVPTEISVKTVKAVEANITDGSVIYGEISSGDNTGAVSQTKTLGRTMSINNPAAIRGVVNKPDMAGVQGINTSSTGITYGVEGYTESSSGAAVHGVNNSTDGDGDAVGVKGETSNLLGIGVHGISKGEFSSEGGIGVGVKGESESIQGAGVEGITHAKQGASYGVWGKNIANGGAGVYGEHEADEGGVGVLGKANGIGVEGTSPHSEGKGVYGLASSITGQAVGVHGEAESPDGYGVYGQNRSTSGSSYGVYGTTESKEGVGIFGINNSSEGVSIGIKGTSVSQSGIGVHGYINSSEGESIGVKGTSASIYGIGVYGESESTIGGIGVMGVSEGDTAVMGVGKSWSAVAGSFKSSGGVALKAESSNGATLIEGYNSSELVFKVDNSGNVYADGTYSSPAADFAELLPGEAELEPGDVLAVNPDGVIVKASAENASKIVGVYSTKPAFLGGANTNMSQDKVPVAIIGVVPVKADVSNGPIRPNDLLSVSPNHHGFAAKAVPLFTLDSGKGVYAGGAVLGRALEGLDASEGVIQMLIQIR